MAAPIPPTTTPPPGPDPQQRTVTVTGLPPPPTPPAPPPAPRSRRLTRSRDDRVIAGVAGGIARYLGVDPVLIRLVWVVLMLVAGSGVLAYLIAWVVIPEDPAEVPDPGGGSPDRAADLEPTPRTISGGGALVGVLLVVVGSLLLADRLVPAIPWHYLGPTLLVVLGVLVLVRPGRAP